MQGVNYSPLQLNCIYLQKLQEKQEIAKFTMCVQLWVSPRALLTRVAQSEELGNAIYFAFPNVTTRVDTACCIAIFPFRSSESKLHALKLSSTNTSLRTQTYFRLSLVPPKITSANLNQKTISVT